MSKASQNSIDFPLFSTNREQRNYSPKKLGGKLIMPDCSHGNSKEFPGYFAHNHQLKSRFSFDNPYIEENFRDKSIK